MLTIIYIIQSLFISIAMIYGAYWIIKHAFFVRKGTDKQSYEEIKAPPNVIWTFIKIVFFMAIALILLPVFFCGGFIFLEVGLKDLIGGNFPIYIVALFFGSLYLVLLKGMYNILF